MAIMRLQLLIIVFSGCLFCINAKICGDVAVRNEAAFLHEQLANCTMVKGNLELLLIDTEDPDHFKDISFPHLTEISGYLLIYRIKQLRTLSHLFPNLCIIRGLKQFKGYSFILHDVFDLTVIDLPNLKFILRGSTRIRNSNELCHVTTIDWEAIGGPSHKLNYQNTNNEECGRCPKKCNGYCWSHLHCQKRPAKNCHPECLDCTEPNAPDKCISCRNYKTNGTCVNQCPNGKVGHALTVSCMTHHQCYSLSGNWWPFQGECIDKCPENYTRIVSDNKQFTCEFCEEDICRRRCSGIEIESNTNTNILKGCTHIHGSLAIRTNCNIQTAKLFDNLAAIREIDGYLKIHRSSTITSLNFLKNLKIVHGRSLYNDKHAVIAFENKNLRKLWERNHTVEVKKGTIYFHDNPKLCFSEIEIFAQKSNLNYSTQFDASRDSNGYNKMCNYIELNVTVVNVTRSNASFVWENVTATKNLKSVIGYTLCYTENRLGNITSFEDHQEYYDDLWDCTFVMDIITLHVTNLKPFTEYAYYLGLYVDSSPEEKENEGLTKLQYFKTLSDYPSELRSFEATSTSSDSVTLSWELPLYPNNILHHYKLAFYAENDDRSVFTQRNFCKNPYVPKSTDTGFRSQECCEPFYRIMRYIRLAKLAEAPQLTCDSINMEMIDDPRHGACRNFMFPYDEFRESGFVPENTHKITRRGINASSLMELILWNTSITTHTIQPFRPFTMYIFLIKVCNQGKSTVCSSPVMASVRTLPKIEADDIPPGFSVNVSERIAYLTWPEPINPNTKIVAYEFEYYRTNKVEVEGILMDCITRDEYVKANHQFQIEQFPEGLYVIRVRAVSLAGPGRFSPYVEFEIKIPLSAVSFVPVICLTLGIIAVIIFVMIGVLHYRLSYTLRRRSDPEQGQLLQDFPTSEPERDPPIPPTKTDHWELQNIDDIECHTHIVKNETFWAAAGIFKSTNEEFMLKTIRKDDLKLRKMFLKKINKLKRMQHSPFTIKLIGVITEVQRPISVLELPLRDLKTHLTDFLGGIPLTPNEANKMGAEIAAGMAFLHSQNIVHIDLGARRCAVFPNTTVKVGEFGFSKLIHRKDYNNSVSPGLLLPVRWMSPEWMGDPRKPSKSSHIWSYGVLLWEIDNLGKLPYTTWSDLKVWNEIGQGKMKKHPLKTNGNTLLRRTMNGCWNKIASPDTHFEKIIKYFRVEGHIHLLGRLQDEEASTSAS